MKTRVTELLGSWHHGDARQAIVEFVERTVAAAVPVEHEGFANDEEAGSVSYTWGQIMVRLKEYAETGKPNPVFI